MHKRVLVMEKQTHYAKVHIMLLDEPLADRLSKFLRDNKRKSNLLPSLIINREGKPSPIALNEMVIILDDDEEMNQILIGEELKKVPGDAHNEENLLTEKNAFFHTVNLDDPERDVHIIAGKSWKQQYNYDKEDLKEYMSEKFPDLNIPLEELYKMECDELGSIVYDFKKDLINSSSIMKEMLQEMGINPDDSIDKILNKLIKHAEKEMKQ